MELKEFVSATLVSIVEGVKAAQEEYDFTGGDRIINPPIFVSEKSVEPKGPAGRAIQSVEFDVAVSTSEATQTKGGIGILVGAIGRFPRQIRFW